MSFLRIGTIDALAIELAVERQRRGAEMWLPRDVARYLEDWAYYPVHRDDFGSNHLSRRIGPARDRGDEKLEPRSTFASLCAVPRGRPAERVVDLSSLAAWLDPNLRRYQPPGIWLQFRTGKRFTSQGILLVEEDYRSNQPDSWEEYILVSRDGYVEYGRQAGFPYGGTLYYQFAPLVAWIQRFVCFILDLRGQLSEPPDYYVLLSVVKAEDAILCSFGDGWTEPWQWHEPTRPPQSFEPRLHIARRLVPEDDAQDNCRGIATWFAERIANAFGLADLRCYNRQGRIGELPERKLEF